MGRRILSYLNVFWAYTTIPLVFFLLVTPPTLLVIPFPLRWRLRVVGPFWRFFANYTLRFGCWASLHVEDHRQEEFRTYPPKGLYIANHQSFLDIPMTLSQFQVPPIMKKEVLYIPLLGVLGWAAGSLVVSRGKRDSRKKVFVKARDRLVKDNFAVQYYPEGTRSKAGIPRQYQGLKVTLLQLAWEEKVPVIPVSIYGTHDVINDLGVMNVGKKLGIISHAALLPANYPDANSFARACWAEVLKGHSQLQVLLEN